MKDIKVGNSRFIKNLNQTGIFKMIYKFGPISRKQLAENTGYSAATISNHVKTLIDEGFVIETEKGFSTGGRKPIFLTVNPDKGYIFGIEIEVTRVKLVLFNLKLNVEMKSVFPIIEDEPPEGTLDRIYEEIQEMLAGKQLAIEDILGIGIAVPGLIDQEQGLLEFAPNLGWSRVNFFEYFKDKCQVPILLENEAKAAVIGEREFVYPEAQNMVFVSVNEGIGCGIIFDGELYRGASGNAGEFGHIIIDSDGPKCHCGNQGCWETLASETYIINSYKRLKGEETAGNKNRIYKQGREGDEEIIKVFRKTGCHLGIGLVNIVNSLSPELLIIGGGITNIKDYINSGVLSVLNSRALSVSLEKTEVEYTKLNQLATVYGLSKLVFDQKIEFT